MLRKADTVCTFAKRSPPCSPTPLFPLSPHPTVYHSDSDNYHKKLILDKEKAIGDFIGQGLLSFLVSCSWNSLWSCSYTGSPREPKQQQKVPVSKYTSDKFMLDITLLHSCCLALSIQDPCQSCCHQIQCLIQNNFVYLACLSW